MGMTAADLALAVGEAAPLLEGASVQRVDQPTALSLCLKARSPGRSVWLFASAHPRFGRLHLAPRRIRGGKPKRFGQYLRRHVERAEIAGLRSLPGERIVELDLAGPGDVTRLVFELFGRNGNIIALRDDGTIADALRIVKGKRRRIAAGEVYAATPSGGAPPNAGPDAGALAAESAGAYFHELYEGLEAEEAFESRRRCLLSSLERARGGAEKRIAAAEEASRAAGRAQGLRRQGELLKANLFRVARGESRVTVQDFFDESLPDVFLDLNARLSPQANVERLFRVARKLERGLAEAEARRADAEARLAEISRLEREAAGAGAAEFDGLARRAEALCGEGRGRDRAGRGGPRRFVSADGLEILVGRDAAENERLTFRMAKGDDLWLHVRGESGSHVVVCLGKGRSAPGQTLVDAATLAAHFSGARGRPRVEVDYTRARYVRKPRKAQRGEALLTRGKTLALRVERDRLARLLGRGEG